MKWEIHWEAFLAISPSLAAGSARRMSSRSISIASTRKCNESTGSFMDYAMPRAADFPAFTVIGNPVPTRTNPFGVKGVGEAGTVGALPAVLAAAIDALAPLGVIRIEMPLTPERMWRTIRDAERAGEEP